MSEWMLNEGDYADNPNHFDPDSDKWDYEEWIAKAQARKLVDFLESPCHHAVKRCFCAICWEQLRQEVGL